MHEMKPIAEGLWAASYTTRMMGVRFPCEATVARGDDGGLLIYSPGPLDDALADAIAALGPVRHVVAPSTFHHLHAAAARARWPSATLSGPPALAKKRPDLALDRVVRPATPSPFGAAFDVCVVTASDKLQELVLRHRPSRTLICCDLVFNVHAHPSWWSRLFLRMAGAYGGLRQSRLWRQYAKDRAAYAASLAPLLDWDIARIVPAHGETYEAPDAAERLASAVAWARA